MRTERVGTTLYVNNVQAAAEELLKWPQRGPLWQKAVEACVAALAGEAPPESVRGLFESAAREAQKLLPVVKDF
ncbi:DUF982 domain-containing protein [Mesorhizobium sp. L2C067A000]|uniref:DUF982 domain-containing protein n=1 Tax=Mesorhizobium sp. L2C067A000 TaxID=1287106 RepID=UPI001FD9303C|nr:DUF982 domain-containing protein [Mesorhizobium sp. L2C067A000]